MVLDNLVWIGLSQVEVGVHQWHVEVEFRQLVVQVGAIDAAAVSEVASHDLHLDVTEIYL